MTCPIIPNTIECFDRFRYVQSVQGYGLINKGIRRYICKLTINALVLWMKQNNKSNMKREHEMIVFHNSGDDNNAKLIKSLHKWNHNGKSYCLVYMCLSYKIMEVAREPQKQCNKASWRLCRRWRCRKYIANFGRILWWWKSQVDFFVMVFYIFLGNRTHDQHLAMHKQRMHCNCSSKPLYEIHTLSCNVSIDGGTTSYVPMICLSKITVYLIGRPVGCHYRPLVPSCACSIGVAM